MMKGEYIEFVMRSGEYVKLGRGRCLFWATEAKRPICGNQDQQNIC